MIGCQLEYLFVLVVVAAVDEIILQRFRRCRCTANVGKGWWWRGEGSKANSQPKTSIRRQLWISMVHRCRPIIKHCRLKIYG